MTVEIKQSRRAYGIGEFAVMFGISKDSAKRHVTRGDLKTICIGARRLVPIEEIERIAREGLGARKARQSKSVSAEAR